MNQRIKDIRLAEASIVKFTAEFDKLRSEALMDGVIDADEQADLDALDTKLNRLKDVVREQNAILERNRGIWDSLSTAKAEFETRLAKLKEASWPDLAKLEAAVEAMGKAEAEQRWEDATKLLEAARAKMATAYQAYLAKQTVPAGGDGDAPAPATPGVDANKSKYESAKAAYTKAMTALERHAQAGDASIAGQITAIKTKATAAETDATAGKFADAFSKVSPLVAECAAVEDKAHDLAHFNAILAHRRQLKDNPIPAALAGDPAIDDLKTEIDTLFTGAQADATAGKYSDGVAKLDRIPALHERRKALDTRRQNYNNDLGQVQALVLQIDNAPAADRAPLQATIDKFKAQVGPASYATTKDYAKSSAAMQKLNQELSAIFGLLRMAAAYTAELANFDAQLAILDPHAGRKAIEEFFQARKADRAQAVTDAAATKFPSAVLLLRRTTPADWTAQKAIADAYVVYDGKRATAQALIDTVKAMPDTADAIKQAEALMTLAASQAIANNVAGAEASVAEATTRANEAKAGSESKAELDALHDTDALDKASEDFDAALDVYTKMRANVAGKDTTNTFAAGLTAADAPVDEAKAEAAKPSPDAALVRSKLDEGIAALQALLLQINAHARYTTHHASTKTLVETTLPPLNDDDCIKPAIDACKALLAEAETLAKAPGYDFAKAETKLAEATKKGREAEANADTYKTDIKGDLATIQASVTAIAATSANIQTLLAARNTRLTGLQTAIAADIAKADFKAAESKGNEGVAVATATVQDIGYCTQIDADYTRWVTNRLPQIQGGQPAVAPALAETNKLIADFNACLASGAYNRAWDITNQLYWSIQRGIDALALATPYNASQTAARAALDALIAKRSPAIEDQIKAFEERYTAAVALGQEPQYAIATQRMTELTAEVNKFAATADAYKSYDPVQAEALKQLTAAEGHPQKVAIETVLGLLRKKYENAVVVAKDGDPARAQTMMDEVITQAKEAISQADFAKTAQAAADAIGDSASETDGPNMLHLAAAKTALVAQRARAHSEIATQEFTDADAAIAKAEDDTASPKDQTEALRVALDLIAEAGNLISQAQLLESALEAARQMIAKHRSHAQAAYLETQLKEAETEIGVISSRAVNLAALPACSSDLEALTARLQELGPKLDAHAEYVALRSKPEVEPRLEVLEKHDHSYAIQSNIEAIRRKLAEATRLSEAFDPVPAVALLKEVETLGHSALVLADMRANTPPTPDAINKILNGPGGEAELDAMIDALEPDAQRAVLKVAFEARFGCSLQNFQGVDANGDPANPIAAGAQDGPNIKRFYEIMSDLPSSATADNDSMRTFTEIETGQGSFYNDASKDVVMREGDAALSVAYTFGAENEVGTVDAGCEPANTEPVSFFSWNTLHEVGHAVDDQHGFMKKNQSGPDYGGWTEYGSNVGPIATILAAHFKYDQRYIQQAMSQTLATASAAGDVPPGAPQPQAGVDPDEWEKRRVQFTTWLAQVREPRSPWASNALAQRVAIGGVVYQESYTGTWTSYQVAARKKGMTGYQFRAPGEWFSELYAAYHSGKLKDSHPAIPWLQKLDAPS